MIPDPRDKRFGLHPLPDWVESFRPVQWEKIEEVVGLFQDGVDVVFLEAPTGTGKTLIAETVRRQLGADCYYTCTTRSLQDQFARDYPYARVLKGRANYLTYEGNIDFLGKKRKPGDTRQSAVTCADCTQTGMGLLDDDDDVDDCVWCPTKGSCPFQIAKKYMMTSELGVLNTHYLLSDGSLDRRDLVVADEADVLEQTVMGHVSVELTPKMMAKYGLKPPDKKTVESSWVKWLMYARQQIREYADELPNVRDVSVAKERTRAKNLSYNLATIAREIPEGGWVYDGYNRHPDHVEFKPVKIAKYTPKILWPKGRKWLLMSATMISPMLMADDLGVLGAGLNWDEVKVPTGFDRTRRPIFYIPVADMSYKNKTDESPKMIEAVDAILKRHEDDRILVHTVSYELADLLTGAFSDGVHARNVLTYRDANAREKALDSYRKRDSSVLFAPSMDRGIDLPGDLCRVQVIAKIPFLNTSDKQVAARLYTEGGHAWYKMQAIRTLVQMCGRGMRSEDDSCVTYILDRQFLENLWKADFLFPDWWKEAVRWDMTMNRLTRG